MRYIDGLLERDEASNGYGELGIRVHFVFVSHPECSTPLILTRVLVKEPCYYPC